MDKPTLGRSAHQHTVPMSPWGRLQLFAYGLEADLAIWPLSGRRSVPPRWWSDVVIN